MADYNEKQSNEDTVFAMARYDVKIRINGAGGSTELTIQTGGARWDSGSFSFSSWQFSPPHEVKIRRLELGGQRIYIERNAGDASEFEINCAIQSDQRQISITSNKSGSVTGAGSVVISTSVDSTTHGNEASPYTDNLRLG